MYQAFSMNTSLPPLILLLVTVFTYGQSAKEIKQNKIKSVTSWQTEEDNGKIVNYKETYEVYDKSGNATLKIRYKKDGSVDTKESYKFDKFQNKTEEILYEGEKMVSSKVFVYDKFQNRTEEREMSPSGGLIKKTTITYTPFGEKSTETTTDSKGNILKKTEYKYNAKNLKIQKTTSNKAKQEESSKKWVYEFY
jgi:hypothetical protein